MGTRADFYVGTGKDAEWIGSIAMDGYPDAIDSPVLKAETPEAFRAAVKDFFTDRRDTTLPEHGWPWPWDDSRTTDFAYAIFDGSVKASCFGRPWYDPIKAAAIEDDEEREEFEGSNAPKMDDFPDMSARQNVTFGARSGLIVLGG